MAFPLIAATAIDDAIVSAAPALPLPAGIVSGNLLIAIVGIGQEFTTTWPAGWTELWDQANGLAAYSGAWRIADGSEGASLTVTFSGGVAGAVSWAARITGAHASAAPQDATPTSFASATAPNPPSVTPAWGALDTLWIAIAASREANGTVNAYPANYTQNQTVVNSGASLSRLAIATRQLNASSDNPGSFTWGAADISSGQTIAVRPAPPGAFTPAVNPYRHLLVR